MSDETPETHGTETEAAAALAAKPMPFEIAGLPTGAAIVAIPPLWDVKGIDAEDSLPAPRRSKGTILVRDAESFALAVIDRLGSSIVRVYADVSTFALVALLNDDTVDVPGWRDYRVALELIKTPEWIHWLGQDGNLQAQDVFAEHVEKGLTELVSPSAADMLDLAQSFHASIDAKFKQARRLASGATQFVYEEDVTASAGRAAALEVPQKIELLIAPFYGSEPAIVSAWFRYRIHRDGVLLGYSLEKPYDVERRAFEFVRDAAVTNLPNAHQIGGPAPLAR